jgi:hypothetical protein
MAARFLKIAAFCIGVFIGFARMIRNIGSAPQRKPQLARPSSLHISEWK